MRGFVTGTVCARVGLCLLACAGVCSMGSIARAQSRAGTAMDGDDVVTLADGTTLRGRVAESRPGHFARIVLVDGTVRTIAWSQIVSANGPAFPAANGTTPPAVVREMPAVAVTVADDATVVAPGSAPLRIESPGRQIILGEPVEGIALNAGANAVHAYRRTCSTPCTLHVAPGPMTVYGTEAVDRAYQTLWTGEVARTGARVQIWWPDDLLTAPDASPSEVLDARDSLRTRVAMRHAWEHTRDEGQRARSNYVTAGVLQVVAASLMILGGYMGFAFSDFGSSCMGGIFGGHCGDSEASLLIMGAGAIGLIPGIYTMSRNPRQLSTLPDEPSMPTEPTAIVIGDDDHDSPR